MLLSAEQRFVVLDFRTAMHFTQCSLKEISDFLFFLPVGTQLSFASLYKILFVLVLSRKAVTLKMFLLKTTDADDHQGRLIT